jgi:putative transposase
MRDASGVEYADLYIRLEHLAHDIEPLAQHLGFTPDVPIANQTARPRDWRGFRTEKDAELLADLCAHDIAAHGYAFDPDGTSD